MFDIFAKVVAIVGRNGEVTEVKKISETKDNVKVRATVQVSSNDYRENSFTLKKTE